MQNSMSSHPLRLLICTFSSSERSTDRAKDKSEPWELGKRGLLRREYCQRLPGDGEEAGAALSLSINKMTVKNCALVPKSQARGCCELNSWKTGSKPTGALSLFAWLFASSLPPVSSTVGTSDTRNAWL